jgi:L-asparaginase / beta-aspartyl-peptidase
MLPPIMSEIVSWSRETTGFSLIVHGGAGDVPFARRAGQAEGCLLAARAAAAVLASGGSALDAVQRAVEILEDDPRFNAGTGASLDEHGQLFHDASIMDGATLAAGGVCALPPFRHPIAVARAAMEDGRHILYTGEGGAAFARRCGMEPVPAESMITDDARRRLEQVRRNEASGNWAGGTVGAVARDRHGHIAAATSTGGITGKRAGRIGDSPIPGAGNYADDHAGGASGTGDGEGFLRTCLAYRTCSMLADGRSAEEAARDAIEHLRTRGRASGGIILLDRRGTLALSRCTTTMSWAGAWDGGDESGV